MERGGDNCLALLHGGCGDIFCEVCTSNPEEVFIQAKTFLGSSLRYVKRIVSFVCSPSANGFAKLSVDGALCKKGWKV